jgi:hypothetical protein
MRHSTEFTSARDWPLWCDIIEVSTGPGIGIEAAPSILGIALQIVLNRVDAECDDLDDGFAAGPPPLPPSPAYLDQDGVSVRPPPSGTTGRLISKIS